MSPAAQTQRRPRSAYAGLDFIRAAFCPLEFTATKFAAHPEYKLLVKDQSLAELEVGKPLHYPRQFPYTNAQGHRKTGTQIITAHFGLAPKDFDLFLGLYTYLRRLPELPEDGRIYLTVDFLARQLGLPATCQKDYLRIRSRIFRFSFVKYTNSAFWNSESKSYDIVNFGFFNLASLSRVTESRRPVVFEWDRTFFRLLNHSTFLTFDYELYRTLSPTLRRLYLIANRDGWNQKHSGIFVAADFAIHQIGYTEEPARSRDRMFKLRKLLKEAEACGIIRPFPDWRGYFQTINQGPRKGELALRWSRGPLLRAKSTDDGRRFTDRAENDALYAQVQEIHDEDRKPVTLPVYRRLLSQFGRDMIQKHIAVILAQKEHHPRSFKKSELAAFINRLQHDHAEPDWFQDLKRAERLSPFQETVPNQLSMEMYKTFFHE